MIEFGGRAATVCSRSSIRSPVRYVKVSRRSRAVNCRRAPASAWRSNSEAPVTTKTRLVLVAIGAQDSRNRSSPSPKTRSCPASKACRSWQQRETESAGNSSSPYWCDESDGRQGDRHHDVRPIPILVAQIRPKRTLILVGQRESAVIEDTPGRGRFARPTVPSDRLRAQRRTRQTTVAPGGPNTARGLATAFPSGHGSRCAEGLTRGTALGVDGTADGQQKQSRERSNLYLRIILRLRLAPFYDAELARFPSQSPLETRADPHDARSGNGDRPEPGRARTGRDRLLGVRVQEVVDVEESQHDAWCQGGMPSRSADRPA